VSKRKRKTAIRRILVAVDASPHSLAALEAAVDFAARMQAELMGLFVEDVQLLRLAESPDAREILLPSATIAPLERSAMEAKFRAHSEGARKALAAAAERARVPWSFRTARGHVASEILAALEEADLLAMATIGSPFGRHFRFGSAALELAGSALPVLLLPAHGARFKGHLLILYDGSAAAKERISVAAELVRAGANRITVLIPAADSQSAQPIQQELETLLADSGADIQYRSFDPADETALIRAVKAERAGVLVLPGRKSLENLPDLESYLGESEMSLLLCGGSEAEEE